MLYSINKKVNEVQEQFSIRLDKKIKDKINEIAKKNSRSMNGQIEFILKNAVTEYEKINGKIEVEKD